MALIRLEVSDEFVYGSTALESAQGLMDEARSLGLIVTKCEIVEGVGHL